MKRRQRRTVAPVRILKKWAPDVGRQSDSGNKKQGNPKGHCKGARGVIGKRHCKGARGAIGKDMVRGLGGVRAEAFAKTGSRDVA